MREKNRRVALLGVCAGVALVLAYAEAMLPPLYAAVPGIKLGLPNIAIIFILYRLGVREAAAVSFVRIVIVSMLFGNIPTFAYSVAGATLSLLGMWLLRRLDRFSVVGVSVVGAVLHNVGQILTAMVLLGTAELGYYLIVLSVTGTLSGIFVGLCGAFTVNRVWKNKR